MGDLLRRHWLAACTLVLMAGGLLDDWLTEQQRRRGGQ